MRGATPESSKYLRIYLEDHRAGAAGGVRLARRCAAHNRDTEFDRQLAEVAREIEEDVRSLDRILDTLEVSRPKLKITLVQAGEWLARAKLNGRLVGRSPLTRLLEVEGLIGGVEVKRQLWVSLALVGDRDERLSVFDFGRLERRAADQLRILQRVHDRFASTMYPLASH